LRTTTARSVSTSGK